jgi:hypothetical protein
MDELSEETVAGDERYLLRSFGTMLNDGHYILFREKLPTVTGNIF